MEIGHLLLLVSGIVNFLLGILIVFFGKKRRNNILYALTVFSVSLWSFGILFFLRQSAPEIAKQWSRIYYLAALLIFYFFLLFSYTFPSGKKKFSWKLPTLLALPILIVTYFLYFTNLHIQKVVVNHQANEVLLGPAYYFYSVVLLGYITLAFLKLFKKHKEETGTRRAQLGYVLGGTMIATLFGVIFNLILPGIGNYRLIWLGPPFTVVMTIFIAYAVVKHHLFNLRVIITELFTASLLLLFFINIFFYQSFTRLIFNIVIFLGATIIGGLLIKSVLQEIKQREQIERAYRKLKRLDEAKTEFISIASHQLRTPLTAIKGYISMILEGNYGEMPEKIKKPMENVFDSNERLINLVNDLLNVSRIESGKLELDLEQASLEKLISEVVEELQVKAKDKDVEIKWKPPQDLPDIRMDYDKMRQVVLNIIDNAISYTEQGEVVVKAKQENNKIKITVSDTGEGMTQEEIEHLFNRFTRGKAGNQLNTEGVGLGLYISKKFVEMHHGKIWAESKGRGQGSTFHITLPINPPQQHEQNTNS